MALIVVIWVLTFLGIALSAFAFAMRTELQAARNFKEEAEAAALAEAGIARALADLANAGTRGGATTAMVPPFDSGEIPLGRGAYRVVVGDEESRILLNQATDEVLRRLLRGTGVRDPRLLTTIVESVLDWRDSDDLPRANGAEADHYRSLPQPYRPKNGPFEFMEELLLVRGVTREIFFGSVGDEQRLAALLGTPPEEREFRAGEYLGIRSFLTVRGAGQVNVNTASLDVLAALGIPTAEAMAILQRRAEAPFTGQLPQAAQGLPLSRVSGTYVVESTGSLTGSPIAFRITATLVREGAAGSPGLRVVSWREGS